MPPRAIFVVGMPRSGTTLLTRLLDGHPQLFVMPNETQGARWVGMRDPVSAFLEESAYGRLYPEGSLEREEFEGELRARLPGPGDLRTTLLAIIGAEIAMRRVSPHAQAWVEKTPRHVRDVPVLLDAFGPQTRVVGMVRDPRAVVASRRDRFKRTSRNHVRHTARRWATVDALTHEYVARHPQFMALTYESLVGDVEGVMRRLCRHLDIAWHESLLAPMQAGSRWHGNSSFARATPGVSTESVARWRDELALEEVAECEACLRPRMAAWGYEPATPVRRGPNLRRALVEVGTAWHLWHHRRAWAKAGAS